MNAQRAGIALLVERELDTDVVTAARQRILNVFNTAGGPVYFSFSGGKDSLCLAHLVISLAGKVDLSRLVVQHVDEEAIFPCVEAIVHDWRRRFMDAGASFQWFCLEVRHYSCLNLIENDESFFCWDRYKRDVWIRQPPDFAIRSHPLFKPRRDSYQQFLPRLNDGQNMTGVRVFESVQRRLNFAMRSASPVYDLTKYNQVQPIYDWRDSDVWLYLRTNDITIPDAYLFMWQIGVSRLRLRISQFFSIDTIGFLAQIAQYYPDLMERICRREPNAYLVSLYYDSDMFRRRTARRRALEPSNGPLRDFNSALLVVLADIPKNFTTAHSRQIARQYLVAVTKLAHALTDDDYRRMYEAVMAGDPKRRSLRAIEHEVRRRYAQSALATGNATVG